MSERFPDMPKRIAVLPRDHRGFPVPWFVAWIDGEPDFRVIDAPKIGIAYRGRRCWLCGGPLGKHLAFVVGPMCTINRTTAEPPSHRDCAEFAGRVCPFLTKPRMKRNEKDLPEEWVSAPGMGLKRNPGAIAVWLTTSYRPFSVPIASPGARGTLFEMGEPTEVIWLAEGRPATRAEVMASVESGLPSLVELAKIDGREGEKELERQYARFLKLLPPQ